MGVLRERQDIKRKLTENDGVVSRSQVIIELCRPWSGLNSYILRGKKTLPARTGMITSPLSGMILSSFPKGCFDSDGGNIR